MPIVDGALWCGYKTVEFDIEKVYKHLVDRGWVEGDESDVGEVESEEVDWDSLFSV